MNLTNLAIVAVPCILVFLALEHDHAPWWAVFVFALCWGMLTAVLGYPVFN